MAGWHVEQTGVEALWVGDGEKEGVERGEEWEGGLVDGTDGEVGWGSLVGRATAGGER